MRRIESDRTDNWHDFLVEIGAQPTVLSIGKFVPTQKIDPFFTQQGQQHFVKNIVLPLNLNMGNTVDLLQHIHRPHAINSHFLSGELDLALEARDPYLEELIHITGEDQQKA